MPVGATQRRSRDASCKAKTKLWTWSCSRIRYLGAKAKTLVLMLAAALTSRRLLRHTPRPTRRTTSAWWPLRYRSTPTQSTSSVMVFRKNTRYTTDATTQAASSTPQFNRARCRWRRTTKTRTPIRTAVQCCSTINCRARSNGSPQTTAQTMRWSAPLSRLSAKTASREPTTKTLND